MSELPVIDIGPLVRAGPDGAVAPEVAWAVDTAARETGFFYVVGHGIDPARFTRLVGLAREFFARPSEEKARCAMARAGRAWRGWFPLGGELTAGRPDGKEGLYFGSELGPDDPRVRAGVPLHGPNLFPERPADLRDAVLTHLADATAVGQLVLRAMAVGLGLEADWFRVHLTADPTVLFRIFHYPPTAEVVGPDGWGVAEHTDYGLLTLLFQDASGGLEVHGPDGWIDVPPQPDSFVVNLGDMLERMTGGRYRSTPHRVRNRSGTDRLSFPLFLDPSWDASIRPVPGLVDDPDRPTGRDRWDGVDVHAWRGTYGQYLLEKVSKVFPALADATGTVGPD